jgi:hypothetical protein
VNWRSLFLNGIVTLVITVAAGLVVYYLTKEPAPASERLLYTLNASATFGTEQDRITFLTISVQNVGRKPARDVRVVANFPQNTLIQDRRVIVSTGPASTIRDDSSPTQLAVSIPNLVPNESAEISLLVKGPEGSRPDLGIKSEDSVGIPVPAPSLAEKKGISKIQRIAIGISITLLLLFQFVWLRSNISSVARIFPTSRSLNNIAFIYLQQGLADRALQLLTTEISTKGADAISLANYGLALGLQGDQDLAAKHLDSASWWANTKHEKAVVEYNRAILEVRKNDLAAAKAHLRKAFSLSRREITRYCELSVHIQSASSKDQGFRDLVDRKGR